METLLGVFSAFGLSASAGLNAYIPLLVVGVIAHYFPDTLKLSQPWDLIANPWILILLGVLVIIEMLADKIPAVNHINDLIQTVVRPIAGAIVFAASAHVVTDIHPVLALACGLLVAGSVHVAKSAVVRPVVTATTGGAGNIPVMGNTVSLGNYAKYQARNFELVPATTSTTFRTTTSESGQH